MKNIHVIATGGTIAGLGKSGQTANYNAGELQVEELIEALPPLGDQIKISCEQFANVDSNDMTMQLWIDLARRINHLAGDPQIDGLVITHGTDTMDEIAYFLSMTVNTQKPVVLTGSMRPASSTSADGLLNLYDSIFTAADEKSRGQNILICFCGTIYSGRNVVKSSTFQLNAFDGRNPSCLGYIQDRNCFYYNSYHSQVYQANSFSLENVGQLPRVDIVYYYTDAPADILDYYAENAEGLVICGSGAGNYSESWIEKISSMNIPVVRASRVMNGMITPTSRFDRSDNVIAAYTLPPQKARILLSLALLYTRNYEGIREIFRQD